jgi:Ca2+-binding EF-hand superfamily protein
LLSNIIKGTKISQIKFKWNVPNEKLEEAKEVYQLMDKANALRKNDLEKAFQLMLENIWCWWE